MTSRIIIVSGVANTGKTTGIRLAMTQLGIHVERQGDIILSVPAYLKNGQLMGGGIGFACGGDNLAAIDTAINFFAGKNVDSLVFACRSRGGGWMRLQQYAAELGVTPSKIIARLPANSATIASQILAALP